MWTATNSSSLYNTVDLVSSFGHKVSINRGKVTVVTSGVARSFDVPVECTLLDRVFHSGPLGHVYVYYGDGEVLRIAESQEGVDIRLVHRDKILQTWKVDALRWQVDERINSAGYVMNAATSDGRHSVCIMGKKATITSCGVDMVLTLPVGNISVVEEVVEWPVARGKELFVYLEDGYAFQATAGEDSVLVKLFSPDDELLTEVRLSGVDKRNFPG